MHLSDFEGYWGNGHRPGDAFNGTFAHEGNETWIAQQL